MPLGSALQNHGGRPYSLFDQPCLLDLVCLCTFAPLILSIQFVPPQSKMPLSISNSKTASDALALAQEKLFASSINSHKYVSICSLEFVSFSSNKPFTKPCTNCIIFSWSNETLLYSPLQKCTHVAKLLFEKQ